MSLARRLCSFVALWTVGQARRPFVAGGGRWWVSWVLVLVRGLLLSLLGGRNHFVGGCRRSWAAGIVCGGGTCVTFHGGDVVAGRMWVGFGQCVEVVVGAWWLLVEEAMSQVCDFGIINVQLAHEINNKL